MKSKIELSFALLFAALISTCPATQADAQDLINSLGIACESGLSPEACEAVSAHDRMNVQTYDQYGRPIPSVYELCREGQMAGGPITETCAVNDLRFNRKGERLVRYDFEKWGYNALDMGVTEKEATKLDSNPTFRAAYIKAHGYKELSEHERAAENRVETTPPKPKYPDSSFEWDHDAPMSDDEYDIGSAISKCKVNRGLAKAKLAAFYKKIKQEQAQGIDPTNGNGGNSIWAMGFTCN